MLHLTSPQTGPRITRDHDELFENVNAWLDFPVDAAGATVQLPCLIRARKGHLSGFTGLLFPLS